MTSDAKDDQTRISTTSGLILADHPGPHPKAHEARVWLRNTKARLGRLLPVAEGKESPTAALIIDHDLTKVPMHPANHRNHDKRLETRMKLTRENEIMMRKRFDIQMSEWTSIYIALAQCTETSHPTLHEEMYECCRLDDRGVPGAYDAPMAWQFVLDSLTVTTRSKEDKKYYDVCLDVLLKNRLADHGTAFAFTKMVESFIVNINPNLSRPFSLEDAGELIIGLLPKCLASDGRRLLEKLTDDGKLTGRTDYPERGLLIFLLLIVRHLCRWCLEPSRPLRIGL